MKRLTTAALVSVILCACGAARPARPSSQMLPLPSGKWTAKLTQSGGFVSVLLTVEVSSDGHLAAADQHSGRSVTLAVSTATIAELSHLITETPISSTGTPSPSCLDCFIYEFELSSEAGTTRIHSDDVTIGNSGAEALIRFVAKLRDAALNGQP